MILTLVSLGKYFEKLSKRKTTKALEELVESTPKNAILEIDGVEKEVLTKDLCVNDIVIVKKGMIIPVVITVYADRSFTFICKTPPAAVLLKKAAGIDTASGEPNKKKVATISRAQAEEIAKTKMPDLNAASLEAATDMIIGTAKSMGIVVE